MKEVFTRAYASENSLILTPIKSCAVLAIGWRRHHIAQDHCLRRYAVLNLTADNQRVMPHRIRFHASIIRGER